MKPIRIRYCEVWNYLPRASRAAALIEDKTGAKAELIAGGRGEFTVWVGDDKVAQKGLEGFPSEQQILKAVQQALDPK